VVSGVFVGFPPNAPGVVAAVIPIRIEPVASAVEIRAAGLIYSAKSVGCVPLQEELK